MVYIALAEIFISEGPEEDKDEEDERGAVGDEVVPEDCDVHLAGI
jgi:hypothetical protein